jgi:cysteinyl-tRNA synthetase
MVDPATQHRIMVTNSLTREKELFRPANPPFVGLYLCGPTVYGEPHLGHARPAITFDVIYRYLTHIGYRVRYVRNITDVGHLENDADEGEDKLAKKARIEQLEPMEVAQMYIDRYYTCMKQLNVLPPSIEPRASGHIIEQIDLIRKIMENGFAYEVNGSVYFDVPAYSQSHHYGKLSGRVTEDLISGTRKLDGQSEKRSPLDFALWKKAAESHIMRWPSPWGEGFPGWHIECSAMSAKYLGETFDIHGGGMDLLFPHHECEIAQSVAGNGNEPVRYWLHNNMITINGQKMGKSLGNAINLGDFFSGTHALLDKDYSPMTIRFFILQAHYRSTLDFSNEALTAAEKGLRKMMTSINLLDSLPVSDHSTSDIPYLITSCKQAMEDDFNTPVLISHLFEGVRIINSVHAGLEKISSADLDILKQLFSDYAVQILGLYDEKQSNHHVLDGVMELIISLRADARLQKNFAASDKIRDELGRLKIKIKDDKEGTRWMYEG